MYKYNPKRITASAFTGQVPFEGYMDAEFIKVEKVSKAVAVHEGGTGEVTAVLNCSQLYKLTVTFVQGSPTNAALAKKVPVASKNYFPVGVLTIKDLDTGVAVVNCQKAFLEDMTGIGYGKDVGPRQWVFYLPDADVSPGGDGTI